MIGLTAYLTALLQGIALQAGGGTSCADLKALIDTSLACWPSK